MTPVMANDTLVVSFRTLEQLRVENQLLPPKLPSLLVMGQGVPICWSQFCDKIVTTSVYVTVMSRYSVSMLSVISRKLI